MKKFIILIIGLWGLGNVVRAQMPDNTKYRSAVADGYDRSGMNFTVVTEAPEAVCQYDTAKLKVTVRGNEEYLYKWWKKGIEYDILSDNAVLFFSSVDYSDKGIYICEVTDISRHSVKRTEVVLNVYKTPVAAIISPVGRDTVLCLNDEIILRGVSSLDGAEVEWSNDKGFSSATANVKVKALQEADYIFSASNRGCSSSDTLSVRLNNPCVNIPSVVNTIEGSAVNVTARTCDGEVIDASALVWYKGATNLGSHNPLKLQNAKNDMSIAVVYTAGSCQATDTLEFRTKGTTAFTGGDDDGYTGNCIPPILLEQKGVVHESCASLGDETELRVVAEGTGVEYRWEKFNTYTYGFEPVVAPEGVTVKGVNSDVLRFSSLTDAASGRYRCVLTGCSEEVISDTFNLSVSGAPILVSGLNAEREHCVGEGYADFNVVATAGSQTGNLMYRWYKDGVLISTEHSNYYRVALSDVSAGGLYKVVVENLCGVAEDSARLVVLNPPVVAEHNDSVDICRGEDAEFWIRMQEAAAYTYTLYRVEVRDPFTLECDIKEMISQGPVNRAIVTGVERSGTYRWRVDHPYCGSTWSKILYLRAEEAPVIAGEPVDTVLCAGNSLVLNCVGESNGFRRLRYQWYKNGMSLAGETSSSLRFPSLVAEDAGRYECAVSNSCPAVKSRTVLLQVKDKPEWSRVNGPLLPEYCEGDTVRGLEVKISSAQDVDSMRWFRGYEPLFETRMAGATASSLQINGVTAAEHNTGFFLRMYNSCGFTDSYYTTETLPHFDVRSPAHFVRGLDGVVDMTLCYGSDTTLCVETSGTPQIRYSWLLNGDTVAMGDVPCLPVDPTRVDVSQKYTCHIHNACGSEITEANIRVLRQPLFDLSGGGHYCAGGAGADLVLSGSDSSCIYRLKNVLTGEELSAVKGSDVRPLGGEIVFGGVKAGEYVVIGVDTNGCEQLMNRQVEVVEDPLPEEFALEVSRYPCGEELTGDLQLSGNEALRVYHLQRYEGGDWVELNLSYAGGHEAIRMPGIGLGVYRVRAVHLLSGCERVFTDSVTLAAHSFPSLCTLDYVNGDSVYCRGADLEVGLEYAASCFEAGSSYQLKKEGADWGEAKRSLPLTWVGLEKGNYRLEVENRWGCKVETGIKIIREKALPEEFGFTGDTLYCGGDTGMKHVRLADSEAGKRYVFYYLSGSVFKDTVSPGGELELEIPLTDRSYYVVAVDTVDGCERLMGDTVRFHKHTLDVKADEPLLWVHVGDTVQLGITISGASGETLIGWDNASYLKDAPTVEDPVTHPLYESRVFQVNVRDAYCTSGAEIEVNTLGGDLIGELREGDCLTPCDSLRICAGEAVSLCGMASGGGGDYIYGWSTETSVVEGATGKSLKEYVPLQSGYIYWQVNSYNERARDSVWITVDAMPEVDTIAGSALRCVLPGDTVGIVLNHSVATTVYVLEYSADGNSYEAIDTLEGTGQALSFVVGQASEHPGYYRIRARIRAADGKGVCSRLMEGRVEIRQAPYVGRISGGWSFCAGDTTGGVITLDSTERGVSYVLWRKPGIEAEHKEGTGDTLKYTGYFEAGIYYVVAERGICRDTLDGRAVVEMYALPEPGELIGAGTYCVPEDGVSIGVSHAEAHKVYLLELDSLVGGNRTEVFYGEGEVVFGTYREAGDYSLAVRDTLTGCSVRKGKVSIRRSPEAFKADGGGTVCYGEPLTDVKLRVYPVEEGVEYMLYRVPSMVLGRFASPVDDSLYYAGSLAAGRYVVKAVVGSCERWSADTIEINVASEIPLPVLTGVREVCEGAQVEIGIDTSFTGYVYTLQLPSGTEVRKTGDGNGYSFGEYDVPGIYRLQVEEGGSGCVRVHDSVYVIEPAPSAYVLSGGGVYCEADSGGRSIMLSGTDSLMFYFIERRQGTAWQEAGRFTGDGGPFVSPSLFGEGVYRIVAGEICCRSMTGEAVIGAVRYPAGDKGLEKEGNACADSTVLFYLSESLSGYGYALYRNDTLLPSTERTGDGGRLEWLEWPAKRGVYRVKTQEAGCLVTVNDSVEIGGVPSLSALAGDSVVCFGASALLYTAEAENGVVYGLYALPFDTLAVEGVMKGGRTEYANVPEGRFYVRASSGDCVVRGNEFRVRQEDELLPAEVEWSDCVERDSGWLLLKSAEAGRRYRTEGNGFLSVISGYEGDTLLSHLPVGIYRVIVEDTLYGCRSRELKNTIREGVYADSLLLPLSYCEQSGGKQLELSGVRLNIRYTILDSIGSELMRVVRPDRVFPLTLGAGRYVFRKERDEPYGCREEREFRVVEEKMPQTDVTVELKGALPFCAGRAYAVELRSSQASVNYYLYDGGTGVYVDTVRGDGGNGAVAFRTLLTLAGKYRVYAESAGGTCLERLDTTLVIHALPALPVVAECRYCYEEGVVAEGCGIVLRGMSEGMHYVLENAVLKDTLEGVGSGVFEKHTAGSYQLVVRDKNSGCADTTQVEIGGFLYPEMFPIEGRCDTVGAISEVVLSGSEKDSVVYELYRDGVYTNRSLIGTGSRLVFPEVILPGIYHIQARKTGSECRLLMEDSVVIYRPLRICGDTMQVKGSFCENLSRGGVTLEYPCSVSGWTYYVTNGVYNSAVIRGGGKLSWNTIAGNYIREGDYELYAVNPCGETVLVAIAGVKALAAPETIELAEVGRSYCAGKSFELTLKRTENHVHYRVKRYSLDYDLMETSLWQQGNGGVLTLGEYAAAGYYEVWARTAEGCEKQITDLTVPVGRMPQLQAITGSDVCISNGSSGTMAVGIPQREAGVAYYLYLNETEVVDSLTSTWQAGQKDFALQDRLGCYTVIAQVENGGCEQKMTGSYCMNTTPLVHNLLVYEDTLNVCAGQEECLQIDENEAGIRYILVRNNSDEVAAVNGNTEGGPLEVGCATDEGLYRVKAVVGECSRWMNDSVYIRLRDLPVLEVVSDYRFCAGTAGIRIKVEAPTSIGQEYFVFAMEGDYSDSRRGDYAGDAFEFDRYVSQPGIYYVETDDGYCGASVEVNVVQDDGPGALALLSPLGNYICEGSALQLELAGTLEDDVTYELYRWGEPEIISLLRGNIFRKKITEPGTYYVTARADTGLYCETNFGSVVLEVADTIRRFAVERVKPVYCETDGGKGSLRLSGSEKGVRYELLRDNEPTGLVLEGTGSSLLWRGVPGKPCSGTASEWDGYVYRVVAHDTLTGCSRPMLGSDTIVEASWSSIVGKELTDLNPCQGEKVQLSVTAAGCANTYEWYQNGVKVKSSREPYYNIASLEALDEGSYYCEVFNVCGDTARSSAVVIEMRKSVVLERPMSDVRLCDGVVRDVMLSAGFGGNIRSYSWYKAGSPEAILGTNAYLKIPEVSDLNAGKYVCRAESGNNCGFMTDTVEIFIGVAPQLSFRSRADTLCVGSDYPAPVLAVQNADSIRWFLNGEALDCTGWSYKKHRIGLEDEGEYAVMTYSYKCGNTLTPVARLWVDDTLRVLDMDTLITGCAGSTEYLSVELSAVERVSYRWEKGGEVLSSERRVLAGPFVANTVENYRVWFRNACSSSAVRNYQDIVVQVPQPISYNESMVRQLILCADGVSDTLLRVEIDPASLAKTKWYFHKYSAAEQVYTGVEADTLRIRNCTANSGYYQSVAYNRCQERVPLPDIWVRIDSIPVVLTGLENDTVCPNSIVHVNLEATGGALTYRWYMLRRSGQLDSVDVYQINYESSAGLTIGQADASYDSCLIWCRLMNSCGEALSDTMLLRVNKHLEVSFTEDTVSFCEGTTGMVYLELANGTLPWSYRYRTPSGEEKEVHSCRKLRDTLWVREKGVYQIVYISDTLNCVRTEAEGLPFVYAEQSEKASLSFSGGGEYCSGDSSLISLKIKGGTGPWEVTITDGEGEALNVTDSYPLRLYGRDTLLHFKVENSAYYHISRSVYDVGSGCWGNPTDSVVEVLVHLPEHIDFLSGPWRVGQCRSINLYNFLRPSIQGTLAVQGRFYVEGQPMGTDHLWPQSALRGDSCYRVAYGYTDEFGCNVSSDEIKVCVDSLPYGEIVSSNVACESTASYFELQLFPAGNIDSVLVRQIRYKKWLPGIKPVVLRRMLYRNDISASGLLQIPLNWDVVDSPDSCMVFEVLNIWDVHGCRMRGDLADVFYRDTIWRNWDPEVKIETKCLSEKEWVSGRNEVNLIEGDSVAVRVTLVKGRPLWNIPALDIYAIPGPDTLLWLKEQGTYHFRPQDGYCNRQPALWPTLKITYLDTGYFRGRLWLEGPYDRDHGLMRTGDCSVKVRDSLNLPLNLPLKPAGTEVIDWVEVELRIGTPIDSVALMTDSAFLLSRDSCLLLSDGHLADRWTGDTIVGIRNAYGSGSNYRYVVVKHRNHLSIMSKRSVRFVKRVDKASAASVDFTQHSAVYCRDGELGNHMIYQTGAGWMMCAGEVNRNNLVTLYDPNRLILEDNGASVLLVREYDVLYDINLDGCVDWPGWAGDGSSEDWKMIKQNRQKFTEIR